VLRTFAFSVSDGPDIVGLRVFEKFVWLPLRGIEPDAGIAVVSLRPTSSNTADFSPIPMLCVEPRTRLTTFPPIFAVLENTVFGPIDAKEALLGVFGDTGPPRKMADDLRDMFDCPIVTDDDGIGLVEDGRAFGPGDVVNLPADEPGLDPLDDCAAK
jgi:hypothetical protein